jgi:hypothetical protein
MDFEEMKTVWDAQNSGAAFKLDEKELHRRILARKKRAVFITNFSELMIISVYTGAGAFVLTSNIYYLAAWMFLVVIMLMISRIRRLRAARRFDRTVRGELQYALATAKYQVRLSRLMRWNIVVIFALALWAIWQAGKPAWTLALMSLFFLLSLYVSVFEQKKYKAQRDSLEALQRELDG